MSADAVSEVIALLRQIVRRQSTPILPQTSILTELDLDSLQTIEFVDALNERFGINFLAPPRKLEDLRSPESIAQALRAAGANDFDP